MLLSHGCSSRGISGYSLHTDGSCPELSNWFIFTRRITESHGFIVPNYRIGLFSHGASRRVTGFMSRIIESLFTRRVTESHGVLSRDLSFGPTDQREVIIELSNFFSHGRSRRFSLSQDMFLVTNLRDLSFGPTDQREVICELVFFTRNVTDGRGGYEGGTIEA